jgi:hypothetical protein
MIPDGWDGMGWDAIWIGWMIMTARDSPVEVRLLRLLSPHATRTFAVR